MKKYYCYIIVGISFVLIISTIAFYFSYTKNIILEKKETSIKKIDDTDVSDKEKGLLVSNSQENIVNSKTEYELIVEDRQTGKIYTEKQNLPVELIGLNKNQVVEFYNLYMDNPGIEETNKGLILCEVINFSGKKIVVKKVYDKKIAENKFFVIEENGFVTVYYQDKKSVFEYTQISVNYLNKEEIEKLKEGFYVENDNKLYSILEGYSS